MRLRSGRSRAEPRGGDGDGVGPAEYRGDLIIVVALEEGEDPGHEQAGLHGGEHDSEEDGPVGGPIDLGRLDYIASAGLRVFLITQKRAKSAGGGLQLINVNQQIYDIFRYAGFDRIISIARGTP